MEPLAQACIDALPTRSVPPSSRLSCYFTKRIAAKIVKVVHNRLIMSPGLMISLARTAQHPTIYNYSVRSTFPFMTFAERDAGSHWPFILCFTLGSYFVYDICTSTAVRAPGRWGADNHQQSITYIELVKDKNKPPYFERPLVRSLNCRSAMRPWQTGVLVNAEPPLHTALLALLSIKTDC